MYKATNEPQYLDAAKSLYNEFLPNYPVTWGFGWGNKYLAVHVMMAELTANNEYTDLVIRAMNHYLYDVQMTPQGLMFLDKWGSLKNSLNTCFMMLQVRAGVSTEISNHLHSHCMS